MSAGLTGVLFAAAALFAAGLLTATWRRDTAGALSGLPAMAGGAALAGAAVSRFAPPGTAPAAGQELAVLVAVGMLALVALATALTRPLPERRSSPEPERPPRRRGGVGGARR